MKTAGVVIDFYDDPNKSLLKQVFPTLESLPELLKTASKFHILNAKEREVLRDEAFALVMQDEGRVIRKFACVDPANTALSTLYFLRTFDRLPEEAVKVAAVNLVEACERFGLSPPTVLKEAAQTPSRKRDVAHQPPVGMEVDWMQRTNLGKAIQGDSDSGKVMSAARQVKTASPRVNVTGKNPRPVVKHAQATRFALGDQYALDSYEDVQRAVTFFSNNYPEFSPKDRHEFCVKTAARAHELGIETTPLIERYGATEYSPDIEAHLTRRRAIAPELSGVWDALLEKRAQVSPDQFAELLTQADEAAFLDWYWGGQVSDPYLATFGGNSAREKTATWRYSFEGGEITGEQLSNLSPEKLKTTFGDDLVTEFTKDPITIFESLPADAKTLIARMAQ